MNKEIIIQLLSLKTDDEFYITLGKLNSSVNENLEILYASDSEKENNNFLQEGKAVSLIVKNWIKNRKSEIIKWICEDLNYCESELKKGSEKSQIIIAITDSLSMWSTGCPIPIVVLAVYLIRFKILDDLCNC